MKKRAFSLLELLVVIGIIATLAAIAVPVSQRMVQSARATACLANLRQLGVALNLYLGEHNQTMPILLAGRTERAQEVAVLDNTLNAYARDPKVFACPADRGQFFTRTGTSYYWNSALNGQSALSLNFFNNTEVSAIPIISDKEGFHPSSASKVNILNADGHVSQGLHFTATP